MKAEHMNIVNYHVLSSFVMLFGRWPKLRHVARSWGNGLPVFASPAKEGFHLKMGYIDVHSTCPSFFGDVPRLLLFWLVVWNFPYIGNNQVINIFFRGRYTTNQYWFHIYVWLNGICQDHRITLHWRWVIHGYPPTFVQKKKDGFYTKDFHRYHIIVVNPITYHP